MASAFQKGTMVVCREGVLDADNPLGLRYGEMYEVKESARTMANIRFLHICDRFGNVFRAKASRFRSLFGTYTWAEDGTPVDITEEYRNAYADACKAKIDAESLFLGQMVRENVPHYEVFYSFVREQQKVTRLFDCRMDTNMAFVTGCRVGMTPDEKKAACGTLAADLRQLSLGYIQLEGYVAMPEPEECEVDAEYPYAVLNKGLGFKAFTELMKALAARYSQDALYVWSPEAKRAYTFHIDLTLKECRNLDIDVRDEWDEVAGSLGYVQQVDRHLLERSIASASRGQGHPEGSTFTFSQEICHGLQDSEFTDKLHWEGEERAKERIMKRNGRNQFLAEVASQIRQDV